MMPRAVDTHLPVSTCPRAWLLRSLADTCLAGSPGPRPWSPYPGRPAQLPPPALCRVYARVTTGRDDPRRAPPARRGHRLDSETGVGAEMPCWPRCGGGPPGTARQGCGLPSCRGARWVRGSASRLRFSSSCAHGRRRAVTPSRQREPRPPGPRLAPHFLTQPPRRPPRCPPPPAAPHTYLRLAHAILTLPPIILHNSSQFLP